MKEEILRKLRPHLENGIADEPDALYLLAEIRKLLEGEGIKGEYPKLVFHCDWALHSKLEGTGAKSVLAQFDEAQPHFAAGTKFGDFPSSLQQEVRRISAMNAFSEQLDEVLDRFQLPPINHKRDDGWVHFMHIYAQIIENIPLVSNAETTKNVSKITVHFETAKEPIKHESRSELLYKVTWRIFDKSGKFGDFFVMNSFSV